MRPLNRLLAIFALGGCALLNPSKLRAEEPSWTSLFNGKNLDGWTAAYAAKPLDDRPPSALFEVVDGTIHAYPKDPAARGLSSPFRMQRETTRSRAGIPSI